MKSHTKNIFLVLLILALAGGGYYFLSRNQPVKEEMRSDKKADIYYCPMHPHYTSDKPGSCPICGMDLVKRKEEHGSRLIGAVSNHAQVNIDEHQRQLIGVKVTPVVRKALVKTLHVPGYVAHDLELYEKQLEYIKEWREFYAQYVRKSVRENSADSWREYYLEPSERNRPRSSEFLSAQNRLIKLKYELLHMGLDESQIESLRKIRYGQPWVQPDLLFFNEGHPFLIYAQIFEDDIGYIDVGQKAQIDIPAYRETYEGVVRSVAGGVDLATRTVRVLVEIPQLRSELKSDMLLNVTFPIELNPGLIVPKEAVMDTGIKKIVFVEKEAGVFEPREIKTNVITGDEVLVDEGLKEGEKVVVSGNFLIDSESRLKAALGTVSEGGQTHEH